MEFLYLHKNGIGFKKVDTEDLNLLLDLKNESWSGTHHTVILNSLNQNDWFERTSRDGNCLYMIAYNQTMAETQVGTMYTSINQVGTFKIPYIDWMNRVANVAHDIFKPSRGLGLSTPVFVAGIDFCFEILNMHRVECEVIENNFASRLSIEKAGLIHEGTKKKSVFKNGVYLDSFVYGLILEDWKKLGRVIENKGSCNQSYSLRRSNG